MIKASDKANTPCEVMAVEVKHVTATVIKINDFNWLVLMRSHKTPLRTKAINCISFEQASYVFDGCVDRLKEWMN